MIVRLIVYFKLDFQTHLALYSFANSQVSIALKLLYRARYLSMLVSGDKHPDIALLDVSIQNGSITRIRVNYSFNAMK